MKLWIREKCISKLSNLTTGATLFIHRCCIRNHQMHYSRHRYYPRRHLFAASVQSWAHPIAKR